MWLYVLTMWLGVALTLSYQRLVVWYQTRSSDQEPDPVEELIMQAEAERDQLYCEEYQRRRVAGFDKGAADYHARDYVDNWSRKQYASNQSLVRDAMARSNRTT